MACEYAAAGFLHHACHHDLRSAPLQPHPQRSPLSWAILNSCTLALSHSQTVQLGQHQIRVCIRSAGGYRLDQGHHFKLSTLPTSITNHLKSRLLCLYAANASHKGTDYQSIGPRFSSLSQQRSRGMPSASPWPSTDLYRVLALPHPWSGVSCTADDIKSAYRRALLRHHPDKAAGLGLKATSAGPDAGSHDPAQAPSIDDISRAKDVLLDPAQKREYDKHLQLLKSSRTDGLARAPAGAGMEVIDLEDMEYSETHLAYVRSCRCGNDVGFQVTEDELEREAEHGEVMVSCPGCSLTARILYQAE